jgi:hypothetical protein
LPLRRAAASAIVAVVLIACGGSDRPRTTRRAPHPASATTSTPTTTSTTLPTTTTPPPPRFAATAAPIEGAVRARIVGSSWRSGCPVPLEDLRYVTLSYWGFDGAAHTGEVVVHADALDAIEGAFRRLFDARFPIRRMQLVDDYGADDFRSIEADNTSAFNCRPVTGGSGWSQHAYGRAIDVDPIENPYVDDGTTSHPASQAYLDRASVRPGMAVRGGTLVEAFAAVGWGWGGNWSNPVDLQHFSATGR